jgi:hypothetical protein
MQSATAGDWISYAECKLHTASWKKGFNLLVAAQ